MLLIHSEVFKVLCLCPDFVIKFVFVSIIIEIVKIISIFIVLGVKFAI